MDLFAASEDSVLTNVVDVTTLLVTAVAIAVILFVVYIFIANLKFKSSLENIAALYKQVVVSEKIVVDYLNNNAKALSKVIGEDLPAVQYGEYCVGELRDCNKTLWDIAKNYGQAGNSDIKDNFYTSASELENLESFTRQFLQECKTAIVDNDGFAGRIMLEMNKKNVFSIYHQYEKFKKAREDYYAEINNKSQLVESSQEQ